MILKYPITAITEASRLSVCYRLDELLRIEHNEMGAKFRANEITKDEWITYRKNIFEPKSRVIHEELGKNRDLASKGTFWSVDIKTTVV